MENEKIIDQKFVAKIQERIVSFLLRLSNNLQIAAQDQCSEMARLVGCWILENKKECKVQILKGKLSDELSHDVLAVESGKALFLIDSTIWQIFPESDSVFIGSVSNISEAISLLHKQYGGTWKVSEIIRRCDKNYQQELLIVIEENNRQKIQKTPWPISAS